MDKEGDDKNHQSEEYTRFEQAMRTILGAPKKKVDAKMEELKKKRKGINKKGSTDKDR
ncbi:MAG: hypothetical protein JWQ98_2023 [Chlorobi bacterium]|nr:hypothetical protein [Chlorobiota bacterium]